MKILIVGLGVHAHHEIAWEKALSKLGCQVFLYGYKKDLIGLKGYIKQRTLIFTEKINQNLIQKSKIIKPDIVFLYRAVLINQKTIKSLQSRGIKVVFFNPDNCFSEDVRKMFWRFHKNSIRNYDHIFAYRQSCLREYNKQGARSSSILKPYYVPWLHWKEKIKSFNDREYDICFIGHCENDFRLKAINRIFNETNFKLLICGRDWKRFSKNYNYRNCVKEPLLGEKYTEAISNSKIALTFFSDWNRDLYTRRVWEIPAAGTVLASPITIPMLSILNFNECLYFSNQEDIVEMLSPILNNEEHWYSLLKNCRERVSNEEYSILGRAKEFLEIINAIFN